MSEDATRRAEPGFRVETDAGGEGALKERALSRVRRLAGVVGSVVVAVGAMTLEVMSQGDLPLLDALLGLVLLAAGVAVVVGIDRAFVWLRRSGRVWSGRMVSLVLTLVSVWGLVRAVQYDNVHHYADGKATNLGQALMGVAFAGVVAGLIGIGITWPRVRLPTEQAEQPEVNARQPQAKEGFPQPGAEPPFEFRSPGRSLWHLVALPVVLVVLLVLTVVSLYVRSADPLIGGVVVLYLVSIFVLPVIPPAYWRRLVVGHEGLKLTRMGTDRFIPWDELRDIRLEGDPDSQDDKTRMRLVTVRGEFASDVPKDMADEMEYWREVVLSTRPPGAAPTSDALVPKPSVAERLIAGARARRRGSLLLLAWGLLASPVLVNALATSR